MHKYPTLRAQGKDNSIAPPCHQISLISWNQKTAAASLHMHGDIRDSKFTLVAEIVLDGCLCLTFYQIHIYICAYVHVLFIPSCIVQYFHMKYWTIVGTTLFTRWFVHLQVYLERLNNSTVLCVECYFWSVAVPCTGTCRHTIKRQESQHSTKTQSNSDIMHYVFLHVEANLVFFNFR